MKNLNYNKVGQVVVNQVYHHVEENHAKDELILNYLKNFMHYYQLYNFTYINIVLSNIFLIT